ncbi:tetratricopeptide repeat protein [Microbulbifer halophilus]|uniref:Tetratricopeptide repeat protein n=1 Tax=Microbulbifer halophilus TaxID=453963 RepID=A0ABW5E9T0_9GAMM|nr:tetratricopeptide repeat protein [Microbulbifer halophilus]MCW8125920.1 tetratricopeptide repeat protein [Microbulbifer halophilus]
MTNPIIQRLREQLGQGKDSPLLRFGLGSALFNDKAHAEAAEHLQACVEQMPDHSAAWKLLGRSLMALDEKERAREVLNRGLDVARDKGDKQVEREIEVFLKKLAKDPN